jgi:YD repeat-containing protein
MKAINLQSRTGTVALLMVLLTGCNDSFWDELRNHKGVGKKTLVDEMVVNGRTYDFVYDEHGRVDYIETDAGYTYEVTYEGGRLKSSAVVEDGKIVSENRNFKYDKDGNIIEYTYTLHDVEYDKVHMLSYDKKGRLTAITTDSGTQSFTYNNKDNVVKASGGTSEVTYTYDRKFNPLNRIPDLLFLVVEETFLWEYILSEDNFVTREEDGVITTYVNEYDAFNRLARKYAESPGDGFTFIYE